MNTAETERSEEQGDTSKGQQLAQELLDVQRVHNEQVAAAHSHAEKASKFAAEMQDGKKPDMTQYDEIEQRYESADNKYYADRMGRWSQAAGTYAENVASKHQDVERNMKPEDAEQFKNPLLGRVSRQSPQLGIVDQEGRNLRPNEAGMRVESKHGKGNPLKLGGEQKRTRSKDLAPHNIHRVVENMASPAHTDREARLNRPKPQAAELGDIRAEIDRIEQDGQAA